MTTVPRRVAVSFLAAASGVLVMFGLLLGRLAGPFAVLAYLVVLLAALVAGVLAARRRVERLRAGRSCSCCTSTVHDPVQVIG